MTAKATSLWNQAKTILRQQLGEDTYLRWIEVIEAKSIDTDALTLCVRNNFYQSWLEENYLSYIQKAIAAVANGRAYAIKFTVDSSAAEHNGAAEHTTHAAPPAKPVRAATRKREDPLLNRQNIFDSFVVGSSNRFAHAAAMAVAQSPGRAYNPLFIYGSSALGKTHLLQAVGNYALSGSQASTSSCWLRRL